MQMERLAKDVCSCPMILVQSHMWKIRLDKSDYQAQAHHDPAPNGETHGDHLSEIRIRDRWPKQSF